MVQHVLHLLFAFNPGYKLTHILFFNAIEMQLNRLHSAVVEPHLKANDPARKHLAWMREKFPCAGSEAMMSTVLPWASKLPLTPAAEM